MLTIYTWGYWGWGHHTRELVHAIRAVERARGYGPPRFADIRISRSVRAPGFNGSAFQKTVGEQDYWHLSRLGNAALQMAEPHPSIVIKDPPAAADLLHWALEAQAERKHVLFFCACAYPRGNPSDCHRTEVARLVLRAAQKEAQNIEIVEWPGGTPQTLDVRLSREEWNKLVHGKRSIPLGSQFPSVEYLSAPWGSIVRVHSGAEVALAITGPAHFGSDHWYLPVPWDPVDLAKSLRDLCARSNLLRREYGLESSLKRVVSHNTAARKKGTLDMNGGAWDSEAIKSFDLSNDPTGERFEAWREDHGEWLVLNQKSTNSFLVHMVRCGHFTFSPGENVNLAKKPKYCFSNRSKMERWLGQQAGVTAVECTDCIKNDGSKG